MKKPKIKKLAPKLPKPRVPEVVKKPFKRPLAPEERVSEAFANVPRITNETVAEHREAVLSGARKYIYPLKHSKHHVVRMSISLLVVVIVAFFLGCCLALYKFGATSGFMYDVTQVVPFPVAKAGSNWVSYESYLFELRRNMHYYQTEQHADFSTKDGKAQLNRLRHQAMDEVIQAAYVKQLAAKNHVAVSDQEVNNEVALVRSENRLGGSNRVLDDVLSEFWGWTEGDFKRELKGQLLQQKVVAKLDTATNEQAAAAMRQLQSGADFATIAAQYSDDAGTKGNGGQYPSAITPDSQNVAPQITAELFKLKAGQISPIVNTGYTLEILKVISVSGNSVQAAHIQFTFQDISTFTKPLQAKRSPHEYIKV